MKTKNLLNLGQMVYIGNPEDRQVRGQITAITLRPEVVRYEVTWWKDDTKKSEWVAEEEMTLSQESKRTKIGFV